MAVAKMHRPYARIRNKPERSVTEIVSTKAIEGLPWAAAKETARQAVHHPESWQDLDPADAIDYLRKFHRGIWDARAAMGTATHSVMESWINDETVDLYELVHRMANQDWQARSWKDSVLDATEALIGYVDGLEKFWNEWQPTRCVTEQCVRTRGVYIGQRDLSCVLRNGKHTLADIKTTAEQDGEKGIYHDAWALQLAGYNWADETVVYDLDENGKVHEVGTGSNPQHDQCVVIHLRGDGDYHLYEVDASKATHDQFLRLADFNKWLRDLGQPREMTA